MQPSSSTGRKLRFAMMPISWVVMIIVVIIVFALIGSISSASIRELFQTRSYWILAVFFPAIFFGKILGLMTLNLIAFSVPPIRRVFDLESKETGRDSFHKAMKDLSKFAALAGILTIFGGALFIWNR